jgi:hypothetical protein
VAKGEDWGRGLEVRGELASLKDTINTTVDGHGTLALSGLSGREGRYHRPCVYLPLLLWLALLLGVP